MNTRFSWRTFSIYLPKHERTLSQRIFPSKLLAYINKVTTMKNRDVTHVIFDMDGLLIETETIYDMTLAELAEQYNRKFTNVARLAILGRTEQDIAKILIKELDLPLNEEEFIQLYRQKNNEKFENVKFMPGAEELIRHLHAHNIPIAVATSSTQAEYDMKTNKLQDVFQLFHHIVCGGSDPEVKFGKPAPDIFLVCASRFPDKPDPSKCIVFEDSPHGIQGSLEAGMQAIIVPAEWLPREFCKPATMCLESLANFQPEFFGLPEW